MAATDQPLTLQQFGRRLRDHIERVGRPGTPGAWEDAVLGAMRGFSPAGPLALQVHRDPKTMEFPDLGEPGRALARLEESGIVASGSWGSTRTWIISAYGPSRRNA